MALVLKDRIKESTVTTGTGTYTLSGAVTGFEAFSSVGDGNTTYYVCTDGTDFEVGIGTYTLSGTTLARTTILESSNSDSAVNWSAGTKTIFCSQPAEKAVFLNASDNLEIGGTAQINGTNGVTISTGAISIKNSGAQSYVDFYCESSNAHYARLLAPAHSDFAGNITLTLPATTQTLVGTAGGAFAGDVTFTGDNYNIVFDKSDDALEFADNAKAVFGAGDDLKIYHSGSNSVIQDSGSGHLFIQGSSVRISDTSANLSAVFEDGGAVELYHNASKKLETASGGISVTGEVAATSLDISGDVDVDGTLEADAMTLDGTAITTTATLSTGISNNNVPKFTSGVADDDFLRVDGTAIEGRSASEVLSDIAAMPLAGGTFTGDVTLTSTDAGSGDDPSIILKRDSSSPADFDNLGNIDFVGKNDASQEVTYASISGMAADVSDGTEDGRIRFSTIVAGSEKAHTDFIEGFLEFRNEQQIRWHAQNGSFACHLAGGTPTADRTITLPDATGTVALTSDIPSSGISSGNVATFTSGVADNDFLRIDGTSVEGRSASEVLSDIGATTAAAAADEATALAIALG
jgi:hypothetical protein